MDIQFFSALADPNRLHIVELLRDGPQPVGDIVSKLHLHQPQVSKHLRVLADAGIVEAKPIAQKRIYDLNPKTMKELDQWLHSFRKLWETRFDRLDKILAAKKRPAYVKTTAGRGRR